MVTLALPCDIPTESNPEASTNFQEYVHGHPTPGVDGFGVSKDYITFDDVERYWTYEKIDQLFLSFNPPIVLSNCEVIKRFLRTLSILAYIGKAGYIHWFFTHDHDDSRLPHESKPYGLPGGDELYTTFSSHQWRFCPYEFSKVPYMKPLDANCILPIAILENLSPVTTDPSRPVIQKVSLKRVWNSLVRTNEERTVVFKTYNGVESSHLWENEVKTFQAIAQSGKCEHIVECLGSFKQIQSNKYTIILEYADGGTLLDLFKEDTPPLKHPDRVQFWERLFDLLIGLQRIHGLQSDRGSKSLMSLRCIHLDIKPANILVFKGKLPGSQNCRFKLADFGSSPTRAVLTGQAMRAEDTGGTPMYSPPECCRDFRHLSYETLTVTPEADIWSLGCVFSETLVWTTMRENEREDYERRRVEATKAVPRITDAGYGGCFHSINSRLVIVDDMHQEAEKYSQRDDKITSLVSAIILKHMLRPQLDGRLPPTNLHRLFKDDVQEKIGFQGMAKPSTMPDRKPPADQVAPQEPKLNDESSSRDKKSKTWASGTSSNEDPRERRPSATPLRPAIPNPTNPPQVQNSAQGSSIVLPMVTAADVNTWRDREGGKRLSRLLPGRAPKEELEGMSHLQQLKERDQYFIVDDSCSMKEYQKKVAETFQALAYLVKRVDDNGLDMYFTSDPKTPQHDKNSGPLAKLILRRKMEGVCMMNLSLDAMANVIIQKNLPIRRPVSVYVLTNGDWGLKGKSLGDVDKTVERLVRELGKRNEASSFIALQFIRFGDLPDGIRRLTKLDNLGKPSVRNPSKKVLEKDIVDHSSYKSSIWKMLIGSLVDGVDNDSDDDDSDWDENTEYVKS